MSVVFLMPHHCSLHPALLTGLWIAIGEQTGPITGPPPPVSKETKAAVSQNISGEAPKKVKTEKECKIQSAPWMLDCDSYSDILRFA